MSHTDKFLMAGVMGWPVMHSRSPLIHKHWFEQTGLKGTYVPLAIVPEKIDAALRALEPLGFAGCNLTIPHKETAMKIVDEVDDAARKIGAISCVTVLPGGRLRGSNNDAIGFIRNIRQAQPNWRADAGAVVVVGAGGGARAVCWGLLQEGAKEIRLVNRTLARAQAIAKEFGPQIKVVDWAQRHQALAGAAMLVNATSSGMVGQPALDLSLEHLPRQALVADIVYIPLETPLLAAARKHGNPTVDGLGMLLHQGPLAWKSWFGIEPAVTPILRALVERSL
jgi:shikimate dehydrogenase